MAELLTKGKKIGITYKISRNEAMKAVIIAINRNEVSKANLIISIISRTMLEERKKKVFTNVVRLNTSDEIDLFQSLHLNSNIEHKTLLLSKDTV